MRLFTFLCFLFATTYHLHAQDLQTRCSSTQLRSENLERHPELVEQQAQIEATQQRWIDENQGFGRAVISIPVVVHVVYFDSSQNIPDNQIYSQIDVLNEDFRKLNSDFTTNVPSSFQSVAADTEIEFCLAQLDPQGNPSTGITRTQTTVPEIGQNSNVKFTASGGHDAWNSQNYLNIWVCEIEESNGPLGYATFPGTALPTEDGVVVDYRFFGRTGNVLAPYDLGRTATHEIGHYLNLEHIWGDGPCLFDDEVFDTPTQESFSMGCPSHPQISCATEDMFMNYMDYTNDGCMGLFTEGQKTRMQATLATTRIGLTNSTACATVGIAATKQETVQATFFPNPSSNGEFRIAIQTSSEQPILLRISDLGGRIILEKEIQKLDEIRLPQLASGLFIATVKIEDQVINQKLIMD